MGFFPVLISRFIYQRLQFFNPCQIGLLTLLYLMRDFVGRQVSRKCVDNAVIKFNLCNDLANLPQVIFVFFCNKGHSSIPTSGENGTRK